MKEHTVSNVLLESCVPNLHQIGYLKVGVLKLKEARPFNFCSKMCLLSRATHTNFFRYFGAHREGQWPLSSTIHFSFV